jgi:hypothetical protein
MAFLITDRSITPILRDRGIPSAPERQVRYLKVPQLASDERFRSLEAYSKANEFLTTSRSKRVLAL